MPTLAYAPSSSQFDDSISFPAKYTKPACLPQKAQQDGTTVNFEGMRLSLSSLDAVAALKVIDGELSLVLDGFKGVISLASQHTTSSRPKSSSKQAPTKKRKLVQLVQSPERSSEHSEHTDCSFPIKLSQPSQPSQPPIDGDRMQREVSTDGLDVGQNNKKAGKRAAVPETSSVPPRSLRKSRQVREDELLAMKLQEEEERVAKSTKLRWVSPKQSGELPCARWGHCCTLVGKTPPTLLVTGGDGLDSSGHTVTLSDALNYDVDSHRWAPAGDHAVVARSFHTATLLENNSGRLLIVFGGENNSPGRKEVLSSLMIMDLDDGVWFHPNVTGEAPSGRSGHSCVLADGNCIFFGGGDASSDTAFNDVIVLDTTQWNWFRPPVGGVPPPPRAYHAAALVDGKMVVVGGEGKEQALQDVHSLDLRTWEWSQLELSGDPLEPICGHAAAVVEGGIAGSTHLVLHGGWGLKSKPKDPKNCFLINTQDWSCRTVIPDGDKKPAGCAGHTLTAGDKGQLILFGGQAQDDSLLQQVLHLKLPKL